MCQMVPSRPFILALAGILVGCHRCEAVADKWFPPPGDTSKRNPTESTYRQGYSPSGNSLDNYVSALTKGSPSMVSVEEIYTLVGRVMSGRTARDFESLSADPDRPIVFLMGPDGLQRLLHKSGYQMLIQLGYTQDMVRRNIIDEGNTLKLVVFHRDSLARVATWDNMMDMLADAYPLVYPKLVAQLHALKSTPFRVRGSLGLWGRGEGDWF